MDRWIDRWVDKQIEMKRWMDGQIDINRRVGYLEDGKGYVCAGEGGIWKIYAHFCCKPNTMVNNKV